MMSRQAGRIVAVVCFLLILLSQAAQAAPVTTTLEIKGASYAVSPTYVSPSSVINLTAEDSGTEGVNRTLYRLKSGPYADVGDYKLYSGEMPITNYYGYYNMTYYSVDNSGNEEAIKKIWLFLDNLAPVTSIHTDSVPVSCTDESVVYSSGSRFFSFTAVDSGSGVNYTEYKIDNGNWKGYTPSSTFSISEIGMHTISYRSMDFVGNREPVKAMDVVIANESSLSGLDVPADTVPVEISNSILLVDGNITVSGILVLDHVLIQFDSSYDGQHKFDVKSGGTLKASGCTAIRSNSDKNYNFYFRGGSSGFIKDSYLENVGYAANGSKGILVASDEIDIENNVITRSYGGIIVQDSSPPIIGNHITWIDTMGISVHGSFTITIKDNIIENCTTGIALYDSRPTIESNRIDYNILHGILVDSSSPIIKSNSITFNSQGVRAINGSFPSIESNTIHENTDYGIFIDKSGPVRITMANSIRYNDFGVYISESSFVQLSGNSIYYNDYGVYVVDSSLSIAIETDNGIGYNQQYGLYLDRSDATVVGNTFSANPIGIYMYDSNPTIQDNNIGSSTNDGVRIEGGSSALIENNEITYTEGTGISVKDSNPVIKTNAIKWGNNGIMLSKSDAVVDGNVIWSNSRIGLEISSSSPTVKGNDFFSNWRHLYTYTEKTPPIRVSTPVIVDNQFKTAHESAISAYFSNPQIIGNVISSSQSFGIRADFNSEPFIANTTISGTGLGGLDIFLSQNTVATIIDTSFDSDKVVVAVNSRLIVKSYFHLQVVDVTGEPISGADVTLIDAKNNVIANNAKTNITGEILLEATVYDQDTIWIDYNFNPYNISISHGGETKYNTTNMSCSRNDPSCYQFRGFLFASGDITFPSTIFMQEDVVNSNALYLSDFIFLTDVEYEIAQTVNVYVTYDPYTGYIDISPSPDWFGEEIIVINATGNEGRISGALTVVVNNTNDVPALSEARVTPSIGTEKTDFEFYATYTDMDNDPPAKISVEINGLEYNMEPMNEGNTDFKNGVMYTYTTKLSVGNYAFSFKASDTTALIPIQTDADSFTVSAQDDTFSEFCTSTGILAVVFMIVAILLFQMAKKKKRQRSSDFSHEGSEDEEESEEDFRMPKYPSPYDLPKMQRNKQSRPGGGQWGRMEKKNGHFKDDKKKW